MFLLTIDLIELNLSTIRGYLDWLTVLPWGLSAKEHFDLKKAVKCLDKGHYGMQDVKNRILVSVFVFF
jgi:Lon-like ATP-dependent protease